MMGSKTITLKDGSALELNRGYKMDCLELLKKLPDNCIDLVLTDPNYGINMDGGNVGYKGFNNFKKKDWDKEPVSKKILDEILRVSKNQIIFGGNYFSLPPSRCWIIWDKGNGFKNRTYAEAELAWTSYDSNVKIFKHDPLANGDYKGKIHPTQKPLKLFKWCLEKYAMPIIEKQKIKPEDFIVADFFGGSFTTGCASHDYGFSWFITETDDDYFRDGTKRVKDYQKQELLQF